MSLHTALHRLAQRVPWKAVGITIALTPAVALVQGAFLLYDYRTKHGNTPYPQIPSCGLEVVGMDEEDDDHDHPSSAPPLRLLVLGDSLAAGVGTSQSRRIPVLPETLARALSKATGGRAVHWDCVGAPGQSAGQIVQDIQQLQLHLASTRLVQRLREWQAEQKQRARHRLESARKKTQEWLEHHRSTNRNPTEQQHQQQQQQNNNQNRIVRWWQRTTQRIRFEWDELRHALSDDDNDHECSLEQQQQQVVSLQQKSLLTSPTAAILRRYTTCMDPEQARQYDVAVVLTGLNDLKDSYLPFMRQSPDPNPLAYEHRSSYSNDDEYNYDHDSTASSCPPEEGLKEQLIRILDALQDKMRVILPVEQRNTTTTSEYNVGTDSSTNRNDASSSSSLERGGPLIVFPGLPYKSTDLNRYPPLSWFLAPLLDAVDRNKQVVAERYPNLVLYVAPPDYNDISDAQAKRGAQWQDFNVLLNLNNDASVVTHDVNQRQHYYEQYWIREHDDEDDDDNIYDQHGAAVDGGNGADTLYAYNELSGVSFMAEHGDSGPPRSGVVAPDGIHPSDSGYDMWGRHIAGAIVRAWEQRRQENYVSPTGATSCTAENAERRNYGDDAK